MTEYNYNELLKTKKEVENSLRKEVINAVVDSVNQPPHYQFGKFSANVIIELVGKTYKSASVFYHVGNALKYLMRAPRKNGLEDLKKAKQSVEFAIECWEDKR
ncbi:nucleotide kinase [Staphylococcus phage EW]|uniref:ORF046 n=1 Tax=Staphylococcus phage EW TaxID=2936814 RepID=Q4ZC12_9CAUD|nr:nucleotide kinase [Staphylococcus phage EW]AAX91382.1 ORF046 [Staphylococcus phage EW]